MTVMTGKLESVGGKPFGGPGHFVVIYSRVTRVARQSDSVILPILDRFEMLSEDEGGDGTFVTNDMDPGPIRVQLEGGDRDGETWDINLPEPEDGDEESWSLAQLIGLQVDWDPVVVSRAEDAARAAQQSLTVTEQWAEQVREDKEHIDTVVHEVMTDAAGMVRDEVKDDADRAETQAGVASEQAGVAAGHAEQAGEDRAQSADDRRQTGEDRVQTGEDREAAEGWAGQSKDAAALAITAAATVTQYVGDGFPEGKVSAPVGSIYTDRLATNGAIRWIKTTGTGNTGWVVEYGDTGWRDVGTLLRSGWEADLVKVRRQNNTVTLSALTLVADNATSGQFLSLPDAFHVPKTLVSVITLDRAQPAYWNASRGLTLTNYSPWTTSDYAESISTWQVEPTRAWPSTLPGTPA